MDVLRSLKFALMGAAEARNRRLVFVGDLIWVHLGESRGLKSRDQEFGDVRLDSKTTAITLLGGYRLIDKGPILLDLAAGGRLNGNRQEVDYRGGLLVVSTSISKTWFDPLVAARTRAHLFGRFGVSVYGDIGTVGSGSKLTWQTIATLDYRINAKMTGGLGWRHLKIDYRDKEGFVYDVAQSGLIFTVRTVY